MPRTRQDTAYWLLGDPESLKFWDDDVDKDEEGRPIPDMNGKMLPTQIQALKHMIYLDIKAILGQYGPYELIMVGWKVFIYEHTPMFTAVAFGK